MPKFRKKPVVIEAVQFDGTNWSEIQRFCGFHKYSGYRDDVNVFVRANIYETTRDPEIVAHVWDKLHSTWVGVKRNQWIIKGVKGEFYPCDDETFRETYEPANTISREAVEASSVSVIDVVREETRKAEREAAREDLRTRGVW